MDVPSIEAPRLAICLPPDLISVGIHLQCKVIPVDNSWTYGCVTTGQIVSVIVHQDVKHLTISPGQAVLVAPLHLQVVGQLHDGHGLHILASFKVPAGRGHHVPVAQVFPDLGPLGEEVSVQQFFLDHVAVCGQLPNGWRGSIGDEEEARFLAPDVSCANYSLAIHNDSPDSSVVGVIGRDPGPYLVACRRLYCYDGWIHFTRLPQSCPYVQNLGIVGILSYGISRAVTGAPKSSSPDCCTLVVDPPHHHLSLTADL